MRVNTNPLEGSKIFTVGLFFQPKHQPQDGSAESRTGLPITKLPTHQSLAVAMQHLGQLLLAVVQQGPKLPKVQGVFV